MPDFKNIQPTSNKNSWAELNDIQKKNHLNWFIQAEVPSKIFKNEKHKRIRNLFFEVS